MTSIKLTFDKGDVPTSAVIMDPTGTEDPRRLMELVNVAAGRAAISRIAQRIFGHTLFTESKEALMRTGQSWWEHTFKGDVSDTEAAKRYAAFAQAQGDTFYSVVTREPDSVIYFGAARWADQGFPTITMGERFAAALCATEVPEEMYGDLKPPWKAFVVEIPAGLFTVYDPEHQERIRATRILVQHVVDSSDEAAWWWTLFSEKDQHFWRQGTVEQILKPIEFGAREQERYRIHAGEAFGEQVSQDERIYHVISRLIFNSILTLLDPERVRRVGSSHKRYEGRDHVGNERLGPPEQRVFIVGKPINLDCRERMREYLEGRSGKTFKVTTQFLVHGHWRWQTHGPKNSLRRRQWLEPYWKGPQDGVIPVREHHFDDDPSDR